MALNFHQYPKEAGGSLTDYMILQTFEYESRGRGSGNNNADGPPKKTFKLPIPDLPNIVSQQKYGQIEGALNNVLASGLGTAYAEIDQAVTAGKMDNFDLGGVAERLKAQVADAGGPVVREQAARVAGALVGINGSMFQSLATGEISNPNVELLYSGPTLRSYAMNWTFAPKSRAEALELYHLVRELKRSHLPTSMGAGKGMLRVPEYFKLSIHVNHEEAPFYQKFFPCFLESIALKQNSSGNHITLPNGEPAISSMGLVFKEIKSLDSSDFEINI